MCSLAIIMPYSIQDCKLASFLWIFILIQGLCTCGVGLQGPLCNETCDPRFYGLNCINRCTCENDGICEPVNGK